jgi:hypothetical protein
VAQTRSVSNDSRETTFKSGSGARAKLFIYAAPRAHVEIQDPRNPVVITLQRQQAILANDTTVINARRQWRERRDPLRQAISNANAFQQRKYGGFCDSGLECKRSASCSATSDSPKRSGNEGHESTARLKPDYRHTLASMLKAALLLGGNCTNVTPEISRQGSTVKDSRSKASLQRRRTSDTQERQHHSTKTTFRQRIRVEGSFTSWSTVTGGAFQGQHLHGTSIQVWGLTSRQ